MAITYTPQGGATYTLGGTMTAPSKGVAGPYPRFSISRETLRKDSIVIGSKFSITITGVALITTTTSMTSKGARQNQIYSIINKLTGQDSDARIGLLEMIPYGGSLTNKVSFKDARLLSVDAPEQNEASAGVQNQEYTFTFEAYQNVKGDQADDMPGILDFSEDWNVSSNDGEYAGTSSGIDAVDPVADIYRTFTITHTLSATGHDFIETAGLSTVVKRGWEKAKAFVVARSHSDPLGATGGATADTSSVKDMNPLNKSGDYYTKGTGTIVPMYMPDVDTDETKFNAYNLVREISRDIAGGTYSITETWTVGKFIATSTIEVSADISNDADYNTISVNYSVQGLEANIDGVVGDDYARKSTKYTNAKVLYAAINPHNVALNFYRDQGYKLKYGGTADDPAALRSVEISRSDTHNVTDGNISSTVAYDDQEICDENAISETLSLTYNNFDGGNQIIALQPIIGRAEGPIIQDMSTTNEKTFSISIEKKMKKDARTVKPDASTLVAEYLPSVTGGAVSVLIYRTNKTESWSPQSGAYSLTEDYTYTDTNGTWYTGPKVCDGEVDDDDGLGTPI